MEAYGNADYALTQESNAMENNGKPIGDHSNGLVVVRPAAEIMSRQQLPYYVRDLRSHSRRKEPFDEFDYHSAGRRC